MNNFLKDFLLATLPVGFDYLRDQAQKTETTIDDSIIEAVEGPLLDYISKL